MEISISKVTNLIPVRIDCVIDGVERSVHAYIDYDTQAVSGLDESFSPIDIPGFIIAVKAFLNQQVLEVDVPVEVIQQYQKGTSFDINDYLKDETLSVQLKKNCKGNPDA